MAWIFKQRDSNHWWIGYRVNGKQIRRSTKTADQEAALKELEKIKLIQQAHRAGSLTAEFYQLITRQQSPGDAYKAFLKQWLAECKELSTATLTRYVDVMDEFSTHLNATDATPLLRDIQPDTVAAFIRNKRATTSPATARVYRKILSSFFRYAIDNQRLHTSPVPSSRALKLTRDSKAVRRAFTLAELKLLFEKAPNDFWRYMLLAGFYCGQRMGDLITLPWGAVDFDKNMIHLVTSKTGASLHIPLRTELRNFLLPLKQKAGEVKPTEPIWPEQARRYAEKGAGAFSNEFYDEVLLPAGLVPPRTHQKAKEVDGRRKRNVNAVSFHCLRHTFVSLLKVTGGSQAVAKELAGHSSDAVSDLYTHVPEEALTKAINQLPEVTK